MCGIDVIVTLDQRIRDTTGIYASIKDESSCESESISRRNYVSRRGPDLENSVVLEEDGFRVDMFSAVLHVQGEKVCSQPLSDDSKQAFLLWNGEFLNHACSGSSDTSMILDKLYKCSSASVALNEVEGPFAFVFVDKLSKRLWFGKDKQGRRSLLVRISSNTLTISSVALERGIEVPAGNSLFCVCLESGIVESIAWPEPIAYSEESFLSMDPMMKSPNVEVLHTVLKSAIERHMKTTSVSAPLGILFSGGVDSAILANIAAEVFLTSSSHNLTGIDLINVACQGSESPDRATGLVAYGDLLSRFPRNLFRFICVDIRQDELNEMKDRISHLAAPNNTLMDFNISSALWFGARGEGRELDACFLEDVDWEEIRKKIVSAESVNSAVENRRPKKCPDPPKLRENVLGDKCILCDRRKWKPGCVENACKICCRDSSCPSHTPFTNNSALVYSASDFIFPYLASSSSKTQCRLLLVGNGADELFGGYGRHETRIQRQGLEALRKELVLDLGRLWSRNLGRDDRVMADHGRDARHPFLDEGVVSLVASYSVGCMQPLKGENKILLRRLAREVVGIDSAISSFRKRAIQFGTRLARGGSKGTDVIKFQKRVS